MQGFKFEIEEKIDTEKSLRSLLTKKKAIPRNYSQEKENETMMKIVNLSIDFRNRSPMRKGIFLYFNDCKIKKSS